MTLVAEDFDDACHLLVDLLGGHSRIIISYLDAEHHRLLTCRDLLSAVNLYEPELLDHILDRISDLCPCNAFIDKE